MSIPGLPRQESISAACCTWPGRLDEAERIYRAGDESEPVLAFNLAVLLEDLGREAEAVAAYREALALDPQLADAHFIWRGSMKKPETRRHRCATCSPTVA